MSTHRTSIAEAFSEVIKAELSESNVGTLYKTNLYGNCSTKILHFDEINDFPFVSVVKSTETVEYQPGGFRWIYLDMFLRVYVRGYDDYDVKLENVISDLISVIDTKENFDYTIENPDGSSSTHKVTEINWLQIGTDEGLLAPDAMGEIRLRVRYEDHCAGLRI